MTGAEIALLVSGLMQGAGSLLGGSGQERESFRNAPQLLQNAVGQTSGLMEAMKGLLGEDINLTQAPSTGSLPTFAGGGMPLPIGALGGAPRGGGGGARLKGLPVTPFDGLRRDERKPTPDAVDTGRKAMPRPPGEIPGQRKRTPGVLSPEELMELAKNAGAI